MPGHGSVFDPAALDDPDAAAELLVRWDELDPRALEQVRSHPVQGPRLRHLELAEAWLVDSAREAAHRRSPAGASAADPGPCPTPEELYDHGRGPGYAPLAEARRSAIESHLAACLDCELAVASLQRRPPLPLDLAPPAEPAPRGPARPADEPRRPRALRPRRRLVPLAIAASALALFGLWTIGRLGGDAGAAGLGLPEAPLLRGESTSPLILPRGLLLAAPADAPDWLDLARLRRFEVDAALEPLDSPDSTGESATANDAYRIVLRATDGGAFDEGRLLADHRGGTQAVGELELLGAPLAPGQYTWEAWRRVNHLDERLGARDFEVVENPWLWSRLAALAARAPGAEPSIETRVEAIRLLHEQGFLTGARALARGLPPSAERDLYLGRKPGR